MKFPFYALCFALPCGCAQLGQHPPAPTPVYVYQSAQLQSSAPRRIVLMPIVNESDDPRAAEQLESALEVELSRTGCFEVVSAGYQEAARCSRAVRQSGRFDEADLIKIARQHEADAVLFTTITAYRPYAPPRIGLSLRLVSPAEASVLASVDGLWDSRDKGTAHQARQFSRHAVDAGQSLLGDELVLASPGLYQRFVCHQVAHCLSTGTYAGKRTSTPDSSAESGMGGGESAVGSRESGGGSRESEVGDSASRNPDEEAS